MKGAKLFSIAYVMTLRPGKYDGYKNAHDNIWPEIARSMRNNNVSISIYRFENLLFLHAAAPTESDWQKSRNDPALANWANYMLEFLKTDGTGGAVFQELPETFAFGLFES